jgi:electron transfer flavoprotein beta subunit
MKSVVLVKQVPEAPTILGEPGGEGRVGTDSPNVTNPYDLFAVEEGLKTREKLGGEVTAITLGPATAVEVLREALAMGVNDAVHVTDPAYEDVDALAAAKILAQAVKKKGDVDVVFVGKQSIDTNTSLTGPAVARHLGMSLLTEVFRVDQVDLDGRTITVERLMEGGLQTVRAKLPALLAMTKDANQPRYASLLGIRKAAKAPVTVWGSADLGAPAPSATKVTSRRVPPARKAGEIFEGETSEVVEKLVEKLTQHKFI